MTLDSETGRRERHRNTLASTMNAAYAIKVEVNDPSVQRWIFQRQKTMYGGKGIAAGDVIFVFASELQGGSGLLARGVVSSAEPVARLPGIERQTPRVTITVERTGTAKRKLGRAELERFGAWSDGRPETELNFKFYRQATNKIVGLSPAAASFLEGCFE